MESTVHIQLGKDRRFAIPAKFCKEARIRPGDGFLMSRHGSQLVLTPLEEEADRMRHDLRSMCGDGVNLLDDLRRMRGADAADEAHHS